MSAQKGKNSDLLYKLNSSIKSLGSTVDSFFEYQISSSECSTSQKTCSKFQPHVQREMNAGQPKLPCKPAQYKTTEPIAADNVHNALRRKKAKRFGLCCSIERSTANNCHKAVAILQPGVEFGGSKTEQRLLRPNSQKLNLANAKT
jgi:hypothetical protein